jgi:transcriptional regulator with XRE-family HTH domain
MTSTTLSAQIIEYLVRSGHSQAQIARMLGVSQAYISLVKSRERGLTLDHLERLAMELSVPLGIFLLAVTEPAQPRRDSKGTRAVLTEAIKKADAAREAILHKAAGAAK